MLKWLENSLRGNSLGPLETQLLTAVRKHQSATVRELMRSEGLQAAYTTVMTTLDRLYKKGHLYRSLEGRAFRYRPAQSEEEVSRQAVAAELSRLLTSSSDPTMPVSFLVDRVTEHD